MPYTPRVVDPSVFQHSPAGKHWESIGIKDHHGIVVPLFSLHSKQSCGIGEYTDLFAFIDWCRSVGLDIVQFLPINDSGMGSSPYSAISAFALHPIYLGLASLPFLDQYPDLKEEIKHLQQATTSGLHIDYHQILKAKRHFLYQYCIHAGPQIISSQAYKDFLERSSDWLTGYAVFKVLKINNQWKNWEDWPQEMQNPTPLLIEQLANQFHEEVQMHCIVQFLCDQQMRAVKSYASGHGMLLMGDIPILTCRDSADVWLNRDLFDLNYSAGAPPDYFSEEGQNWGFPLYNWDKINQLDFKWWVDRLQVASAYYHLYRIDHIVGFFRIWSIPKGLKSKDGHFIPGDQSTWVEHGRRIMWMMLEKCNMLPIGEDLGVIPPEVRTCMSMLGICGTRVVRWERRWNTDRKYIPFSDYALDSMTTVSTHDSEPLRVWWRNNPEEAKAFAEYKGWPYQEQLTQEQYKEIMHDTHHSNSLFHINLLQEYLGLIPELSWPNIEDDRINVPGIVSDKNWTYRLKPSIEELSQSEKLKSLMHELIFR